MGSTPGARQAHALRVVSAAVARRVRADRPALFAVACSGGADSLALADATIAAAGAGHVAVLTVDHGLQAGSAAVAARVVAWAEGQGAIAMARRVDVARGASLEAAARDARRVALRAMADELGCAVIYLGHTASDQAETALMRIVRGTGVSGLAAMAEVTPPFARPLLGVTRADVEAYCAARRLAVWADPMNADRAFTRVRARREWLPMLARENPHIEAALVRLAASAAEHAEHVDRAAAAFAWPVDCGALAAVPPAVRKRVVARGLEAAGLGYDARHLEAIDELVCAPRRGTVALDVAGGRVIRAYDLLEVRPRASADAADAPRPQVGAPPFPVPPGHVLRKFRAGDRMRPRRRGGRSRKLSDLFGELRVPRELRSHARVLVRISDDEIVWAEHVGPS